MSEFSREHEINRRELLKLASLVAIAVTPLSKAVAASTSGLRVMLGRPTSNSISLSVIASKASSLFVEYGTAAGKLTKKSKAQSASIGMPVLFDVTGLTANTTYYYRVRNTDGSTATEGRFTTQRKSGSTFSFTVHGDTHPERKGKMFNEELYLVTLSNIAAQKPDFHIMLGDDFSIDPLIGKGAATVSSVDSIYATHRQWLETIGATVPLYLVNGNHEQAAAYLLDGTTNNPAVYAGKARVKYFPLPSSNSFYSADKTSVEGVGLLRDYYAWEWGNALFVVIDPYWHSKFPVDNVAGVDDPNQQGAAATPSTDPTASATPTTSTKKGTAKTTNTKKGSTTTATGGGSGKTSNLWSIGIGDEQYAWLKSTLEKSKAKYKFVFAHHVMGTGRGAVEVSRDYEWGGRDPKGTTTFKAERPKWELPIHDLMVKNKVTIFFQGHDHIFVTQERDGLIYQSMPNPADDTFSMFNEAAYLTGTKAPNSGHVRVTVSSAQVKVEYFLAARAQDSSRSNLQLAHSYTIK